MKKELINSIKKLLESGEVEAVVFLRGEEGDLVPAVVSDSSDEAIREVYTGDSKFPMAAFACLVEPGYQEKIAVVMRECDRRMLVELSKHNKIAFDKIVPLGMPCSQELADSCICDHPVPSNCEFETATKPVSKEPGDAEPADADKLSYWMDHFSRCIRCLGCRNVCPLCYCSDCALDNPELLGPDVFPPDIPIFHLIRAIDMADRCIDCGMCEEVCPADIPLRELYRNALSSMKEALDYIPGLDIEEKSPLEVLGEPNQLGGMEEGYRGE
ncbi:MAG: 4Fe-4S binding protein [Actinobacteria bacterium]|nr:4Fe-4S binding protein [Actinomycetota bacterium]